MNHNLLIILILAFTIKTARSESCAPVGNRAEALPIYDQGQTSMCYAYTATQLWDLWRKKNGEKVPPLTSASELAFRYTFRNPSVTQWKEVKSGSTFWAATMLFNEGGCPYYNAEDFKRDVFGERWEEFESLNKMRQEYFKLEERIEQGKKSSGFFSSKDPREKQQELVDKFACDLTQKGIFSDETRFMSEFIKKALDTGTTSKYFQKYFEKGCIKHGRLTSPGKLQSWGITDPKSSNENIIQLKRRLNSALESGKSVPGISYCSGVLYGPGTNGITITKNGIDCSMGDSHASIVVDRRPGRNGSCEYLVRNTWGTSCNSYAWPCKMGQVWVPESELLKNTMSVMWIE